MEYYKEKANGEVETKPISPIYGDAVTEEMKSAKNWTEYLEAVKRRYPDIVPAYFLRGY